MPDRFSFALMYGDLRKGWQIEKCARILQLILNQCRFLSRMLTPNSVANTKGKDPLSPTLLESSKNMCDVFEGKDHQAKIFPRTNSTDGETIHFRPLLGVSR